MAFHRMPVTAVVVLIAAALPAHARAQAIPAACRPLLDAQRKVLMTPHHSYATEGAATQGSNARVNEAISAGGVNYILYNGTWRRSPMSPSAQLAQMQENIAHAGALACQRVGTESVGGVAADVYTSHDEHDGSANDARHWVAKGTGLILRTDEDFNTGAGKRHISIRYEYANVRAPAGVR